MPECSIHQLIYLWYRERVLRARLVEVGEINANPSLPVLIFYHHCVEQPLGEKHLLDSLRLVQFFYFFIHCFHMGFC